MAVIGRRTPPRRRAAPAVHGAVAAGIQSRSITGKISWFGGPHDPTSGPTTASGSPIAAGGIAVYNQGTLGGWWRVTFPNGKSYVIKQTDIGPAPSTGRVVDVAYSSLGQVGYTEANFPTDAKVTATYLGKAKPGGGSSLLEILNPLNPGTITKGVGEIAGKAGQVGSFVASSSQQEQAGKDIGNWLTGGLTGWVKELLQGLGKLALTGVLLLAGAVLVIYGIMVAVRPRERAFSIPVR